MKLYYTDPLASAYMAREFGVEFLKDGLCDEETQCYWKIHVNTKFYNNAVQLMLLDKHKIRFIIHPDSLHIFEPMNGDLVVNYTVDENLYYEWDSRSIFEDGEEIIQRNGKAFFMPESEAMRG